MAHDWQVGDLAVCVEAGLWTDLELGHQIPGPDLNDICAVEGVEHDSDGIWLWIVGYPEDAHGAHCFRKISPDEQSGEIEDWNLILETTKRRVQA